MPQTLEAGNGKDDSVEFTFRKLSQSCVDVSAQIDKLQVRKPMPQLDLPSQTARTDSSILVKFVKLRTIRDEGVAGVFTFRNRCKIYSIGKLKRYVFETVNSEIDPAVEKRFVEFLC